MTPLDSLARGYSIAVTARRHHLTEAAVRAVADAHGMPGGCTRPACREATA